MVHLNRKNQKRKPKLKKLMKKLSNLKLEIENLILSMRKKRIKNLKIFLIC